MLKILAVCGNGQGTSVVLRLGLEPVLAELGLGDASVECTALGQAQGMMNFVDLIIVAAHLADSIEPPKGKPVIVVNNLIDKKEVKAKVVEALEKYYPHLLNK
jgi:PTS system ascorbate-specific IIB component